jgi:thiol-disulfide isomerase/thioredoxin
MYAMHLAYFHAPWCAVCHEKGPLVDELAAETGLTLESWNVDEAEGAAEGERLRIKTVPTLALIHGERVPFKLIGAMITAENVAFQMDRVRSTLS